MTTQTQILTHRAFLPRDSKRDLSHQWRRKFLALGKTLNPLGRQPSNLNEPK